MSNEASGPGISPVYFFGEHNGTVITDIHPRYSGGKNQARH